MTSPDEPAESQQESQPPDAIAAPGRLRRYWLWIALSAAVALAGFAAVNLPGHGHAFPGAAGAHGSAPTATGAGGATGGAGPNPDATEPVPAAIPSPAGVATSPSHLPRRVAASLARWKAGGGGATLAFLSAQMGNAMQAGGLKLYPTMRLACTKVGTAVTAARTSPPIPDAVMQGWYARALGSLARAAADCRAGISVHPYGDENTRTRVHPKAVDRARAEFATGARELFRATAKILSL